MSKPWKKVGLPSWTAAGFTVATLVAVAAGVMMAGVLAGVALRPAPLIVALCVVAGALLSGALWGRRRTEERHRGETPRVEASHRALLTRFEHIVDQASDIILLADEDLRIVEANDRATTTYGYGHEELLRLRLPDLLPQDERPALLERLEALPEKGSTVLETVHVTAGGFRFPVDVSERTIDVEGRRHLQCIIRDISERKEAEDTIERLAYFDPLTGLANRRLFEDRLTMALAQTRRTGRPLAVVFVDIDQFKVINDTLGHAAGDQIIQEVANRLSEIVREQDTIARFGGDEFVLLVLDVGRNEAPVVGDRLLAAVREPIVIGGERLDVSVSVGIAVSDGTLQAGPELLQQADLAMYAVKEAGGNDHKLHEPKMSSAIADHFLMRNELRDAFEAGGLAIHYQPLVRTIDRTVVGAEALLRWNHQKRGPVPAPVFVAVAEESGLIVPLGAWVLGQACRQACAWHRAGFPGLRMAVNVSARQFHHDDLVATVRNALAESGLDPQLLEIEITESVAMRHTPQVSSALRSIQSLGVTIAVDDFGTAYSSFRSISDIPVRTLKVDRSFVEQMAKTRESGAVVRTIVDLGRHMGLRTVAEGVETPEQLALLSHMRCNEVQGFLFSPAVEACRFPAAAAGIDRNSYSPTRELAGTS